MNKNIILLAVIPGAIVATALTLSVRAQVNADSIVGFGCVLMLAAIAALDYRAQARKTSTR